MNDASVIEKDGLDENLQLTTPRDALVERCDVNDCRVLEEYIAIGITISHIETLPGILLYLKPNFAKIISIVHLTNLSSLRLDR